MDKVYTGRLVTIGNHYAVEVTVKSVEPSAPDPEFFWLDEDYGVYSYRLKPIRKPRYGTRWSDPDTARAAYRKFLSELPPNVSEEIND